MTGKKSEQKECPATFNKGDLCIYENGEDYGIFEIVGEARYFETEMPRPGWHFPIEWTGNRDWHGWAHVDTLRPQPKVESKPPGLVVRWKFDGGTTMDQDYIEYVRQSVEQKGALRMLAINKALAEQEKKEKAKNAAEQRHGRAGGTRDKKEEIRKIWATGKYDSRDVCAEQECAALGMSFSTARKALRNTPAPKR